MSKIAAYCPQDGYKLEDVEGELKCPYCYAKIQYNVYNKTEMSWPEVMAFGEGMLLASIMALFKLNIINGILLTTALAAVIMGYWHSKK